MKTHIKVLLGTIACSALTLTPANAAIVGIDSITLGAGNSLDTATVGGVAYSGGVIADEAQYDAGSGAFDSIAPGDPVPVGTAITGLSVNQEDAWDDDVLTGVAGSNAGNQTDGILALYWNDGLGFTDSDTDPDFFVFEDLGNDSVFVQAILADNTAGEKVALSGWSTVRTDGLLSVGSSGSNTGRTVSGLAFNFTDLKDASGTNLTNGTVINGILIGDDGEADFYEVYANVVPEPGSLALLGLGGLLIGARRRRHA